MDILARRNGRYVDVSVKIDSATFEIGLHDQKELAALISDLLTWVNDLERYLDEEPESCAKCGNSIRE